MKVTNKITIHLDDLREIRPVDVMQCDVHTRELEIALFAGGKKWEIPNSVTPVISYRKPDGTKGLYDTLPNGNPACRIEANVVRAVLPPSALEAPGRVDLVLIFTDDDDNQLAAFGVPVDVHRNPGVGAVASGDYFNLQKWVKEIAVAAVPKALPNPQKLILTGAVETEYDGSGEVKVEIPVGGSKDVHIGSEPPTNGEAIWINPDEEPEDDDVSLEEVVSQVVDNCVPTWAKQPNKPKYTAAEVGALPADTPIPEGVTDEQIKNAVDAYLTENPPEGGGIPIPSSAQVGQTIVVKAVDESGKPTEWEAVDLPSGGEKKWELFGSNTLTEDVSDYIIGDMTNDANSFVTKEYTELLILCSLKGHTSVTSKTSVNIQANTNAGGQSQVFTNFIPASGTSSYWIVHAKMMANGEIRISVGNAGQYATTTTTKWQILSDKMRAMSFIRYFRFVAAKFGAGSTIEIYGR